MRFRRFDLVRFGHFTGATLDLPPGNPDFHLLLGANEAGKTTVMRAVEDLLFGFPVRTPYDFLHPYAELRLGAVVEEEGEQLEFLRRKGSKDTVLDAEGAPFPRGERRLATYLGGADRDFFGRMFNLGHERLARGGREILQSHGEVGKTLFSAGSGLLELRKEARRLDEEAETLWGPRKKRTRRYTQARDRFDTTKRSLLDTIRRPQEWKELHRRVETSEAEVARLRGEAAERSREQRVASRIRRVHPSVRRRVELEACLAEVGDVALLPEDAAERLRQAQASRREGNAQVSVLEEQLATKRKEADGLGRDDEVMARSEGIGRLLETQSQVSGMRADLPTRRAEWKTAGEELLRQAAELGWPVADPDALAGRVPSRADVDRARRLREKRGSLEEALRARRENLDTARRRLREQEAGLAGGGTDVDAERLAEVLAAHPEASDLDARLRHLEEKLGDAQDRADELLPGLHPAPPEVRELADLPVPPRPTVREAGERMRDLRNRCDELERSLAVQRGELTRARAERDRQVREEDAPPREALIEARRVRDDLWARIRSRLAGEPAADEEDPSADFEAAVRTADEAADRRFDRAEAAGRLAELDRVILGLEADIAQNEAALRSCAAEQEEVSARWRELWSASGVAPDSPEAMLAWLDRRDQVVLAQREVRRARRQVEAGRAEEERAREDLLGALGAAGVPPADFRKRRISALLRKAQELERESSATASDRAAAGRTRSELAGLRARVDAAEADWKAWEEAWDAAIRGLGLDPGTPRETLHEQLDRFDAMRQTAETMRNLQERRIGAMERDIRRFESAVLEFAGFDASLDGLPPDEAVTRLGRRLEAARRDRKERARLEEEVASLRASLAERQKALSETEASLTPLREAAGTANGDEEGLEAAVRRSDERRNLERELAEVRERLDRDGDGLTFEELQAECGGTDPEEARAREEAASAAHDAVQADLQQAVTEAAEAKSALRAFHGDAAAARLAAEREEALQGMRAAAARYAEVRTAQLLLRWALERFRRQNQEPLLRRAGELFRTLTDGSFARLEVGFDDRDELRLDAVRADDRAIPVTGLSSGTEDQLFLALRVAAIEDYLERGGALPFIADDLFINFDDRRSAAGFRVLGRLAKKTQVLFFTHHEHLLPVARRALRHKVAVLRLDGAAQESA